jgi:hypothetical protein
MLDANVPVHVVQARLGHEDHRRRPASTPDSRRRPTRRLLTRSAKIGTDADKGCQ